MNETAITVVGNTATDIRFQRTAAGVPAASFRLAFRPRRYNREASCWVDGDTSFVTVWTFRGLAENVAGSVERGDPVVVTGHLRVRDWEREGQRQTVVEVEARSVGHDLARGTSAFRRMIREPSPEAGAGSGAAVPADMSTH
ncbi:hypothetical protein BIV57_17025 [Mangrovactinospora gilvigrisea]|uniref:Single-stranded DNA-binding protein n=1 Tax=Mangrovactinospora gilvigrisea TaxID=1428644 RepID=A0A1J7BCA8_9ACTN|nr:single-stranded DNA-binding protein [Mangrovactinospora gilvigrisea]OIV36278.1 hypothetical protein BIV57_17025 [Mangrovactinospora gilvigrisea]